MHRVLARTGTLILIFLAVSHLSSAQSVETISLEEEPVALQPATGDIVLHHLSARGLSLHGQAIYDWSGEIDSASSPHGFGRYSLDFQVPVDVEKLLGWRRSAGVVRLKHHVQKFGEDCVGEAQLYSNIDADSRTTLYEAWLEQRWMSERIRLKGGKIDANTEFAVVQTAGDFLNASMGYSPTIMAFPTYPEPKVGFIAFLRPEKRVATGVGVFQTNGMGILSIVEPGISWKAEPDAWGGRVSGGYWHLSSRTIPRFDGRYASGAQGFYSVIEQNIWPRSQSSAGDRISVFAQLGWAEGSVSPFTRHAGGGAVLQGPIPSRTKDAFGAATTWVRFSSYTQAGFDHAGEQVFETYYKAVISSHVALVQDFQYFHHPGGRRMNPDRPVVTPRLILSF